MRDLRARLVALEKKAKRQAPVMVRIPEATLDMNRMAGFDPRTWLQEGMLLKPADTGAMNTLPRQPAAATAQEAAVAALFLLVNPAG